MVRAKQLSRIVVEVAYARADQQTIIELELDEGATAGNAIEESNILQRYSEIDLRVNKIGVFSKPVGLDWRLRDRDRVEIYRSLPVNPPGLRRQRAAATKRMKKPLTRC